MKFFKKYIKILVIDNGVIVERGDHESLINRRAFITICITTSFKNWICHRN